ncbi:MAG: hypothetical protein ABW096_04070 [Candidatus Thiodiazotropha sp.]
MKSSTKYLLVLSIVPILTSCVAATTAKQQRIDEVPMYGGMDRSSMPELKDGDEKFISSVTEKFGSREKASTAWVDQGFKFYKDDQLGMAMRRFNQAWLLDPENPEVYWGFAAVLTDQEKYCEAANHIDMAFAKGKIQDSALPDAGIMYSGCVAVNSGLTESEKSAYISKTDAVFNEALESPAVSDKYVYFHWSRAMYALKDWESAWDKVQKYESSTGETMSSQFKDAIRKNMGNQ